LTADVFVEAPQGYPTQRATPVATVDIIVLAFVEGERATATIIINRNQVRDVGAEPEELQIERFTGNQYQPLSIGIVSTDSEQATFCAETPGFPVFVVSVLAATALTPTITLESPTPTPESPIPTPTAMPTSTLTGTPGLGLIVAIIAVITLEVIIRHRNQQEK
jgi:hypothetical protein